MHHRTAPLVARGPRRAPDLRGAARGRLTALRAPLALALVWALGLGGVAPAGAQQEPSDAAPSAGAAAAAPAPIRVALLPMVVHSAEDPRYLREGMGDMLESRLERVGRIRVVRVEDPDVSTTRLARAVSVGRQFGADYVLFGSFTRFGAGASLDLTCAPTREGVTENDQYREIFVQSGSVEEVIPGLEDLVGKVALFMQGDAGTPAVASNGDGAGAPGGSDGDGTGPGASGARAATGGGSAARAAELEELRRRVEALEAAVYGRDASTGTPP